MFAVKLVSFSVRTWEQSSVEVFAPCGIILFRYEFPHACGSAFTKSC